MASVIPYPDTVVGLPVTPDHGTLLALVAFVAFVALVAVAALPLTLIPHVPDAHTPVRDGAYPPIFELVISVFHGFHVAISPLRVLNAIVSPPP
jgi:hypothetical protein